MVRGDQCKGKQSLSLCGNLDGDLKHAEQLPNVNPCYILGNLLIGRILPQNLFNL